ncbi:uncharacterized protein [Drosophila virilis]|uniref:Uncharacterized protein n=1 Tax=Drosophila virilis TaxID=7244 RepID=A0A0Q9WCM5_DROVI|nr:uncharacterized protein LOC6633110 [Drosophila virilis]KRF78587.1 uncharacterized protein Dvir_GJ10574 [Drosophila virilis]
MRNVQQQEQTITNNSATSSENSETQSVEELQKGLPTNNQSAALIRAKTSWKRMKDLAAEKEKENETKRPPWRAVSVSTLSKPDKNALLRAKLLDASRRLRAGKTNVALQTDFIPTKVMKEAVTGVQDDMILFKDIGILTDGQYSIKKDNNQQYVLTYSISQMTDRVDKTDVSTQTLLPKAYNKNIIDSSLFDFKHHDKDATCDFNKSKEFRAFNSTLGIRDIPLNPTLLSWQFDDDAIEMEVKESFIPYTIESFKPWRSFIPIPFYIRSNTLVGRQKVDWGFLLQSIDDLVRESNNLLDRLQTIMHQKNLQRKHVHKTMDEIRKFQPTNFRFPSDYWLPIIEKQETQLQLLLDPK